MIKIDIPAGLADNIAALREPRKDRRGWQSRPYTSQPFSWFDTVYNTVEAELGPIENFWFNVNTQGEGTGWHSHSHYQRVAVLYVCVPGGAIEFKEGEGYWQEIPSAGDLMVFPGTLEHRVLPNPSADYRISVAFNFKKR